MRLRKQREKIEEGDYVYLRVKRYDEDEHRHKLAAVAAGPYPVLEVKRKTVMKIREKETVDSVSRDRVKHAPVPRTKDET